jgi:hypothetical protein
VDCSKFKAGQIHYTNLAGYGILKFILIIFILEPEVCDVSVAVTCGFDLIMVALETDNIQLRYVSLLCTLVSRCVFAVTQLSYNYVIYQETF